MKMKHLRDAVERSKEIDDEAEVLFIHDARVEPDKGVHIECRPIAGSISHKKNGKWFMYFTPWEVAEMLNQNISNLVSDGTGTAEIVTDQSIDLAMINYKSKKKKNES